MLLLLEAAQRSGLTPIPGWQIHRLAFLADCLSPVYGLPTRLGRVRKAQSGPFDVDRQWELDRIAVQGLAHLTNIHHRDFAAHVWFFADYSLTSAGMAAADAAAAVSPWAAETRVYLLEVAGAQEELGLRARKRAALSDATYSDPRFLDKHVIEFSEWQQNFSVRATEAFQAFVPGGVPLNRRDRLYLYFRYLDRVMDQAVG